MPAPITAARLAAATEVSLRSLYRDIDALRAAGARIEGERGYGYRLVEDYALPPQTFDRFEIEALALGLAEVRSMGDPVLAGAAASALAKITATLPDDREQYLVHAISQVFRPTPRYAPSPHTEAVRTACWREEALRISYADKDGAGTDRMILPLAVIHTDRTQTVLAWCCLREGFRMFRADRLRDVNPTGKSFRPRRAVLLREYLSELEQRRSHTAENGRRERV